MRSSGPDGFTFTFDPASGDVIPVTKGVSINPKTGQAIKAPVVISDGIGVSESAGGGSSRGEAPGDANYQHPAGFRFDAKSGFWVNAQGAVDPKDPAVAAALAKANPTGSTGADAGTTSAPAGPAATDYSGMLGIYGLPADVQAKVNSIFQNTADVNQATALAMAYVRGTPWYAQTYPGIQEGIAKGVVGNEADYRSYLNNINNLTQQFQGRQVGGDELAGYLRSGFSVEHVNRLFAGQAYIGANRNDIQYAAGAMDAQGQFSGAELTALGNENAGLDSELGQRIQNRLNLAQQRIRAAFSGSLATPGLSTANGRLQATTLGGGTTPGDVAA